MSKQVHCAAVAECKVAGESVCITAVDGLPLAGRIYEPPGVALATVLALPGIGVPQRLFRHIGDWLARRGVRTVSVDYRGIGDSDTPDGNETASLSTWARADAVGALRFVRARYAADPVLLGHSFGGQVLGIAEELHAVRAAILVGSQLGHPHHWDGLSRLKIEFFWRALLPVTSRLFDPVPKWVVGESIPVGVAREWIRWAVGPDWLFAYVADAETRYASFSRPIRAYAISDDDIAPPRAVDALLQHFTGAEVTRVDIRPEALERREVGHVGLFRPTDTEQVWREWLHFVTRHAQDTCESKPLDSLERSGT